LSCGILTWGFCNFSHLKNDLLYGVVAFLGTFCVYNFQRLVKSKQRTHPSAQNQWVEENLIGVYLSIALSFVGLMYVLWQLVIWTPIIIVIGAFAFFVCVFYIIRIRGRNLRELPFLKIHLISSIWVITISIFPLLNEQNFEMNNWIFGSVHYAYFLAVCIPFDIRDLRNDSSEQKTIPQILGLQSAKMIAMLLLVCFIVISMTFRQELATKNFFLIAVIFQLLLVYFTNKQSSDFYFGILIDGAILLLGLSYFF